MRETIEQERGEEVGGDKGERNNEDEKEKR